MLRWSHNFSPTLRSPSSPSLPSHKPQHTFAERSLLNITYRPQPSTGTIQALADQPPTQPSIPPPTKPQPESTCQASPSMDDKCSFIFTLSAFPHSTSRCAYIPDIIFHAHPLSSLGLGCGSGFLFGVLVPVYVP